MSISIYALACPDTGEIRYIGKAKDPQQRLATHISDTRRRDGPIQRWVRKLISAGKKPLLIVLESGLTADSWQDAERRLIAAAREYPGCQKLLNVADGGDEPYCSHEDRAKAARAATIARTRTPVAAEFYRLKREVGGALKRGYLCQEAKSKLLAHVTKYPHLFPASWPQLLAS